MSTSHEAQVFSISRVMSKLLGRALCLLGSLEVTVAAGAEEG